jgi:hypothetical protein
MKIAKGVEGYGKNVDCFIFFPTPVSEETVRLLA